MYDEIKNMKLWWMFPFTVVLRHMAIYIYGHMHTCAVDVYLFLEKAQTDACVHQPLSRVYVRVQNFGDRDAL